MAAKRDLSNAGCLVVGGSAGSVNIIYRMLGLMAADFPIPVIVIIHRGKQFKSNMQELFQLKSAVKIKEADEKDQLEAGTVYLAPANFHLLVEPERTLSLDASEPVMYCRPAIDVTFSSAADVYGQSLIGILLSGANEDGAAGIAYIEKMGGTIVIQHPDDAQVDTMPAAAIAGSENPLISDSNGIMEFVKQISVQKRKHLS